MSEVDPKWYRKIWSLEIKNQSWVEDTENQVDFIINTLGLTGRERILDLACGFGRHAISFARRGFSVVGADITEEYIEDAIRASNSASLDVAFINADIRDLKFKNEFDVVLNLADGAIGYLEDDKENLKIFDVIAEALKPGGKHFMDICNAAHAVRFFPKRHWEIGSNAVSLPEFDWDRENRRMLFSDWGIEFGKTANRPEEVKPISSTRLYSIQELKAICEQRSMEVVKTFSDYYGKKASNRELQLLVYSRKK